MNYYFKYLSPTFRATGMSMLYPKWKTQILQKETDIQLFSQVAKKPNETRIPLLEQLYPMMVKQTEELKNLKTMMLEQKEQTDNVKNIKKISDHTDDLIEVLTFKIQDVHAKLEAIQKSISTNKMQVISNETDSEELLEENTCEWNAMEDSEDVINPKQQRESKKEKKARKRGNRDKQQQEKPEKMKTSSTLMIWSRTKVSCALAYYEYRYDNRLCGSGNNFIQSKLKQGSA